MFSIATETMTTGHLYHHSLSIKKTSLLTFPPYCNLGAWRTRPSSSTIFSLIEIPKSWTYWSLLKSAFLTWKIKCTYLKTIIDTLKPPLTATFSQWPLFYVPANYPYIHSYVNFPTTTATAQWQWPLKCVPIDKITFQQQPVNLWVTTKQQVVFGKGHKTWSLPCIVNLYFWFIVDCVTTLCATIGIFFQNKKVAPQKRTGVIWHPYLPIMAKSL